MGAVVRIAVAEEVPPEFPEKNCQHDLPPPLRRPALLRGLGRPAVLLPATLCPAAAVGAPPATIPPSVSSAVPAAHEVRVPGAAPSLPVPARRGSCCFS